MKITLIGTMINIITIVILIVQIWLAKKTFVMSQDRQKKTDTLTFIYQSEELIERNLYILSKKVNNFNIDTSNDETIGYDLVINNNALSELTTVLSLYEYICTGIYLRIFDEKTVNRLTGHFMINFYGTVKPFIDEYRMITGHNRKFIDFEETIKRFVMLRNNGEELGVEAETVKEFTKK